MSGNNLTGGDVYTYHEFKYPGSASDRIGGGCDKQASSPQSRDATARSAPTSGACLTKITSEVGGTYHDRPGFGPIALIDEIQ